MSLQSPFIDPSKGFSTLVVVKKMMMMMMMRKLPKSLFVDLFQILMHLVMMMG
jgi:hypothetical protein